MSVPSPIGRWVPDPLSPSGFRWQRHDEQPPTHMLPTVAPSPKPRESGSTVHYQEYEDHQLAVPAEQDDLTDLDESAGELVSTEKLGPLDEVLIQPPQDPEWRP